MIDRRRRGKSGEARTPANYVDRGREKGTPRGGKSDIWRVPNRFSHKRSLQGGNCYRVVVGGKSAEAFVRVLGREDPKGLLGNWGAISAQYPFNNTSSAMLHSANIRPINKWKSEE